MAQIEKRNLVLFIIGKFISIFGSSMYTFAISLYVLKITGSSLSFATTIVLGIIPMVIINPFAGVIADKMDKKKIIVIMDILNGILFFAIYTISRSQNLTLQIIYASTFIMTIFSSVFGITFEAAKPEIVNKSMLITINSASKIIDSISQIMGPIAGGIIFALVDINLFILINSISFLISAVFECFIIFKFKNDENKLSNDSSINFKKDIGEGIRYILKNDYIKFLFSVFMIINFFLGFAITVPMPYIINNILNLGSVNFGIIEGAFPVGVMIGALFVKRIENEKKYIDSFFPIIILLSLSMILIGVPLLLSYNGYMKFAYVIYYSLIMGILGVIISFIDIPIFSILQKRIPGYILGRVLSISVTFAKILLPIGLISAGVVIEFIPAYILPIIGGILFFIINLFNFKNFDREKVYGFYWC